MRKSDVARAAVALLVALVACEQGVVSTDAGTPSLMVSIGFADVRPQTVAPIDRVVIVLSGPASRQLNAIPGDTIRIDRLQVGTYTVRAEGWAGSFLAWLDETIVTVRAGATVTAQIDDVPFEVEPPQISSPDTIVFGDSISLSWSPHPRATSYLVEWSTSSAFDGVVDVATTTSTSIAIDLGALGAYHLRVSPMEGTNRGPPTPFARSIVVAAPVLLPSELCSDYPSFAIATFEDANLAGAIRGALNVGSEDRLACELMSGLSALHAQDGQITSLVGLQNLTGLDTLDLSRNPITDISPIAGLTDLAHLLLFENAITDISPLSGLTGLTALLLSDNSITELGPLAGHTSLTSLALNGNAIRDIYPLDALVGLTALGLSRNVISDISPLAELVRLEHLTLGDNAISDISALAGLTGLTLLVLGQNSIADISPLAELTALTDLWLNSNDLSDVTPLGGLTSVSHLSLAANQVIDVSPVSTLTDLSELYLNLNESLSDIQPLLDNEGLGAGDTVWVTDTNVSCADVAALETKGVTVISGCQ